MLHPVERWPHRMWNLNNPPRCTLAPKEGAQLGFTVSLEVWLFWRSSALPPTSLQCFLLALAVGERPQSGSEHSLTAVCLPFAATGDLQSLPWKQNHGLFFQKMSQSNLCRAGVCVCVSESHRRRGEKWEEGICIEPPILLDSRGVDYFR